MIAKTPTGHIGIICDKCSYIIEHKVDLKTYLKTNSTIRFCNTCKPKKEREG